MWYKAANQSFITLYHGTSLENYLLIKRSGVLKKSDVPNLTTSKDLAKSFGKQLFGGEETVILSFVIPRNLIEGRVGVTATVIGDISMKYCKLVEKFDSSDVSIKNPGDERHLLETKRVEQSKWTAEQERLAVDKLAELKRNPLAYVPSWMKVDKRFGDKV